MVNDAKVGAIFQEIAQIVIDMIPEKWAKVYLYSEVEEERQGTFFYYYPTTGKEPVYSLDIPELFHVDEDEFDQLKDQLYQYVENLWNVFKQSEHEPWSTLTMIMEEGKFKSQFGYEDLSAPDTDFFTRRLAWRYHHLGIAPKDSFAKKVLDEYLKKREDSQEQ
jgi:uncharacterized protein (TIGR01741 family)